MGKKKTRQEGLAPEPGHQPGIGSPVGPSRPLISRPGSWTRPFASCAGRAPVTMREDFCGTAILSATWVLSSPDRKALGLDLDQGDPGLGPGAQPGSGDRGGPRGGSIELRLQDVRTVTTPPVDVVCAYNSLLPDPSPG